MGRKGRKGGQSAPVETGVCVIENLRDSFTRVDQRAGLCPFFYSFKKHLKGRKHDQL